MNPSITPSITPSKLPSSIRNGLSSLIVVVAGVLTASAHAQYPTHQVKVAIPFAFQDGSTHLNPGVYTLSLQGGNLMVVRGPWGGNAALSLVNVGSDAGPVSTGKVIFHRYGDRYFLHEVWIGGSSLRIECPRSKAEKDLQTERQLASNNAPPDTNEVALLARPN